MIPDPPLRNVVAPSTGALVRHFLFWFAVVIVGAMCLMAIFK